MRHRQTPTTQSGIFNIPYENLVVTVFTMIDVMQDVTAYVGIGALCFGIGLVVGYMLLSRYYNARFIYVSQQCADDDSIIPLLNELERES